MGNCSGGRGGAGGGGGSGFTGGTKGVGGGVTEFVPKGSANIGENETVQGFIARQYGIDIAQYRDASTEKYDQPGVTTIDISQMPRNDRVKIYEGQTAYGKLNYAVESIGAWGLQILTGKALEQWTAGMDKIWGKGKWTTPSYVR